MELALSKGQGAVIKNVAEASRSVLFLLASGPWLLRQNYYGNVLKTFADLQTNACVTPATLVPKYIRETLKNVHEDVTSR